MVLVRDEEARYRVRANRSAKSGNELLRGFERALWHDEHIALGVAENPRPHLFPA